jgi:hypothetical protein
MKIPSSDPESAHQIGSDDILFMSFRGGNQNPLLVFQIDLAGAWATGQV